MPGLAPATRVGSLFGTLVLPTVGTVSGLPYQPSRRFPVVPGGEAPTRHPLGTLEVVRVSPTREPSGLLRAVLIGISRVVCSGASSGSSSDLVVAGVGTSRDPPTRSPTSGI